MGVWISLQSCAAVRLFHATRYECLADVDVAPPVHKMLASKFRLYVWPSDREIIKGRVASGLGWGIGSLSRVLFCCKFVKKSEQDKYSPTGSTKVKRSFVINLTCLSVYCMLWDAVKRSCMSHTRALSRALLLPRADEYQWSSFWEILYLKSNLLIVYCTTPERRRG